MENEGKETQAKAEKAKLDTRGKTFIKGTGLTGFCENTHAACVDVKDGKLLRIRPLPFDWKYSPEHYKPWKIEARGKTFGPTSASLWRHSAWPTKSASTRPTASSTP